MAHNTRDGEARRGGDVERQGGGPRGEAMRGEAMRGEARRGVAWRGEVWRGEVRRGEARRSGAFALTKRGGGRDVRNWRWRL